MTTVSIVHRGAALDPLRSSPSRSCRREVLDGARGIGVPRPSAAPLAPVALGHRRRARGQDGTRRRHGRALAARPARPTASRPQRIDELVDASRQRLIDGARAAARLPHVRTVSTTTPTKHVNAPSGAWRCSAWAPGVENLMLAATERGAGVVLGGGTDLLPGGGPRLRWPPDDVAPPRARARRPPDPSYVPRERPAVPLDASCRSVRRDRALSHGPGATGTTRSVRVMPSSRHRERLPSEVDRGAAGVERGALSSPARCGA